MTVVRPPDDDAGDDAGDGGVVGGHDEGDGADLALQATAIEAEHRAWRLRRARKLSRFSTVSFVAGLLVLGATTLGWVLGFFGTSTEGFRGGVLLGVAFTVGGVLAGVLSSISLAALGRDDDAPEDLDRDPDIPPDPGPFGDFRKM